MRSIRFIASSILSSLVVAGCASHSALTPSIPASQVESPSTVHADASGLPLVVQSVGSSRWVNIQDCCGYYGDQDTVVGGFNGSVWLPEIGESILRVGVDGSQKTFQTPRVDQFTLTTGPDGNMWFGIGQQPSEIGS